MQQIIFQVHEGQLLKILPKDDDKLLVIALFEIFKELDKGIQKRAIERMTEINEGK